MSALEWHIKYPWWARLLSTASAFHPGSAVGKQPWIRHGLIIINVTSTTHQNHHLCLCCGYVLCPQWYIWHWQHAFRMHMCSWYLVPWQWPEWLHVYQHRPNTDPTQHSMCGLNVAHARLFFSFIHEWVKYSCAFVKWFSQIRDCANENTGMWSVEPEIFEDGVPNSSIIHLDSVVQLAHLLPIYHDMWAPSRQQLNFTWSLDTFTTFYVNKYTDHHTFEIAF